MLKEDPLREPLSGGDEKRKRKEGERQIEGGKARERQVESELQDGEEKEGRERKTERRGGRQQSSCTLSWQISFTH